jgi:uncharacterized protein YeaO (DUF488 family)
VEAPFYAERGGAGVTATVAYRRIYDEPRSSERQRVLVDRVWPRGIRRDERRFDEWLPEIAPSTDLRRWYGHEPGRFEEFRHRYLSELDEPSRAGAAAHLRELTSHGGLTLLTATRDAEHSQAAVLAEWLSSTER